MELLENMVVIFLIFGVISILFSIMAAPVYIPTSGAKCSLCSMFLPTLVMSCLFDNSHTDRCEVVSHCGFDLHFPDD